MSKFDYFMILAEMRTGSNFLEANLNELDGVTCMARRSTRRLLATRSWISCLA